MGLHIVVCLGLCNSKNVKHVERKQGLHFAFVCKTGSATERHAEEQAFCRLTAHPAAYATERVCGCQPPVTGLRKVGNKTNL